MAGCICGTPSPVSLPCPFGFSPGSCERPKRKIETYSGSCGSQEIQLAARDLKLRLDDDVYALLLELGSSRKFGARELRRVVNRVVRQPLAKTILSREDQTGEVRVSVKDGQLVFR